jgi:hypothetical protein
MNKQGVSHQGNHIFSAVHVLNFVIDQNVLARLKSFTSCKDFVASKLRHHERAPGIPARLGRRRECEWKGVWDASLQAVGVETGLTCERKHYRPISANLGIPKARA